MLSTLDKSLLAAVCFSAAGDEIGSLALFYTENKTVKHSFLTLEEKLPQN